MTKDWTKDDVEEFQHIGPQFHARGSAVEIAVAAERERCAKIADEYAAPNRFSVSEEWKSSYSPAEVYDAAATDVGGWIAAEIRKAP